MTIVLLIALVPVPSIVVIATLILVVVISLFMVLLLLTRRIVLRWSLPVLLMLPIPRLLALPRGVRIATVFLLRAYRSPLLATTVARRSVLSLLRVGHVNPKTLLGSEVPV